MFANASLARRIERADAGLIITIARAAERRVPAGQTFLHELNGGVAAFVEPGAPYNKVAGLGFDGVPADADLDLVERAFDARRAPLQFEVASLGDAGIVQRLTTRGYTLLGFENVLGIAIPPAGSIHTTDQIRVTAATPEEAAGWMDAMTSGFMTPDVYDGPPSPDVIPREVLENIFGDTVAAGFERYIAWRGDEIAGAATFRAQDGVAQFCGAATLPAHRRRGVQGALLRHRLRRAAELGCDVGVVTTAPGSTSQANVQKAGFALLYVRAMLNRAPR